MTLAELEKRVQVLEDIEAEAVKVSMICRAENYTALKDIFQEFEVEHLVVDPEITCYRSCPGEGYEESEVVYGRSPQAQHSGWQGKGNRVPVLLVQVHCLCTLV